MLAGTASGLVRELHRGAGAVDVAVVVLDRVLLALIVAELLYTLRFVVRTHEIAVEPFLYIGLIAVVRRILIVTVQLERGAPSGQPWPPRSSLSVERENVCWDVPSAVAGIEANKHGLVLATVEANHATNASVGDAHSVASSDCYDVKGGRSMGGKQRHCRILCRRQTERFGAI